MAHKLYAAARSVMVFHSVGESGSEGSGNVSDRRERDPCAEVLNGPRRLGTSGGHICSSSGRDHCKTVLWPKSATVRCLLAQCVVDYTVAVAPPTMECICGLVEFCCGLGG